MKLLLSLIRLIKEFKLFDISIYKNTVFFFALYIASRVPRFSEINPLIWLIIGVVCIGYLMTFTYRKRDDANGYFETVMANFHDYKVIDMAAFEIGMFTIGLALYQYIPRLQTINPTRYLSIFIFGLAWIWSMRAH